MREEKSRVEKMEKEMIRSTASKSNFAILLKENHVKRRDSTMKQVDIKINKTFPFQH